MVIFSPVAASPRRVVSTFLCTDEYVYRLVSRANIAALSFEATDRHPVVSTIADRAAGILVIHPDTETVLALKPDLVVMYEGVNPRLHANLERLKIPVFDVPWANSLADVRRITRMLGARLGAQSRAEALLADMDRKLAAAKARAPSPPVGAILYQPNGYAGAGAAADELLAAAGIRNVAPALGASPAGTIPVETVVAKAPELLIFSDEERNGTGRAYQILRHPALRALDGKTHRAFANLTPLMCPGPWLADTAQSLGAVAREARALAKPPPSH